MLEKLRDSAGAAAAIASRRAFLGRFGRAAMGASFAVGGLIASGYRAHAARGGGCPAGTHKPRCHDGTVLCCPSGTRCVGHRDDIHCGK